MSRRWQAWFQALASLRTQAPSMQWKASRSLSVSSLSLGASTSVSSIQRSWQLRWYLVLTRERVKSMRRFQVRLLLSLPFLSCFVFPLLPSFPLILTSPFFLSSRALFSSLFSHTRWNQGTISFRYLRTDGWRLRLGFVPSRESNQSNESHSEENPAEQTTASRLPWHPSKSPIEVS
jgi:hypothetical protein